MKKSTRRCRLPACRMEPEAFLTFARLAVLRQAGADERQATSMQWRLSVLGHKMSELECRIVQLLRLLDISSLEPEEGPREGAGLGR